MRQADYIIRISSSDAANLQGCIEHVASGQGYGFKNLNEMVINLENDMNRRGFPAAHYEFRQWAGLSPRDLALAMDTGHEYEIEELQAIFSNRQPVNSFWLSVRFRQNADWQGELVWMDRSESVFFRSILELTILLHTAMSCRTRSSERLAQLARGI